MFFIMYCLLMCKEVDLFVSLTTEQNVKTMADYLFAKHSSRNKIDKFEKLCIILMTTTISIYFVNSDKVLKIMPVCLQLLLYVTHNTFYFYFHFQCIRQSAFTKEYIFLETI